MNQKPPHVNPLITWEKLPIPEGSNSPTNKDSKFDAKLSEDKYLDSDRKQFNECNKQLSEAIEKDPKLKEKFDSDQLEQIKNGDTPDGYVWHHDAEPGKMQLVDSETHQKTAHTGGRCIWGGGGSFR